MTPRSWCGAVAAALVIGVGAGRATSRAQDPAPLPAERVTGVGGVFFKAKDPQGLTNWYRDHLGVDFFGK